MTGADLCPVHDGVAIEGVRVELRYQDSDDDPSVLTAYLAIVTTEGAPPVRIFLASLGQTVESVQPMLVQQFKFLCASSMNTWIATLFGVAGFAMTYLELPPGAPIPQFQRDDDAGEAGV